MIHGSGDVNRCLEAAQRSVWLIGQLNDSLWAAEGAIAAMQPSAMEQEVRRQWALCREWIEVQNQYRQLQASLLSINEEGMRGYVADGGSHRALAQLEAQMKEAARELTYRARIHLALLRRLRCTIVLLEHIARGTNTNYAESVACANTAPRLLVGS